MRRKNDTPEYTARHAAGTPTVSEEASNTTEFPTVNEPTIPIVSELIPPMEEPAKPKKRWTLFGWLKKKEPLPLEEDEEEESLMVAEKAPVEDVPDDTREISLSNDGEMGDTRVIELAEDGGSHLVEDEASQMLLEGFADESEEEPAELSQEEALRRVRQEKIQDFSQRREQHEREMTEAEAVAVEPTSDEETEAPVAEAEEQEDEAAPVQETLETLSLSTIRQRLQQQVHRSGVTLVISVFLEIVLFFIALISAASPAIAIDPVTYLGIHLTLFIILMITNGAQIRSGLVALFGNHRVTVEGVLSIVSILVVLHTALLATDVGSVADGTAPVLTGVAGLGLMLQQISHRLELSRAVHDFGILSSKSEKLVMKRIEDDVLAEEIGRPAVAIGVPRVAYFRRTEETEACVDKQGFDPSSGFLAWYFLLTCALSLIVALSYLLINGFTLWPMALTILCGMLAISAPMLMGISLYSALFSADNHARESKTAISGYAAAVSYGNSHAIALDAMELFPETSVMLHGIKTFSGTRVDEAILDAASVSIRAGGPLSHVFRRMILNKVDMLHEVDTLVYEQDMGLSGWISGRRILIGNRRLLDNHGIDIPSKDYEDRYAINGRQLVYLSIAGELSAMFVVSYNADPTVRRILKTLTERHITLLVRTCDQNVTEPLLCSVFGLNGYYVELLNAPAGRSFEALVSGVSTSEPAQIVSCGGSLGMLTALAQCRRLRTSIKLFAVLQSLFGVVGMALIAVPALLGGATFPPLYGIEFLGLSALVLSFIARLFAKK